MAYRRPLTPTQMVVITILWLALVIWIISSGLRLDGFHAPQVAEFFVGFAFDVHAGRLNAQISGNVGAHGGNVRREFGLLRDDGGIHVHNAPAQSLHALIRFAQQYAAVGIFEFGGGIGEMAADVAQARRAK